MVATKQLQPSSQNSTHTDACHVRHCVVSVHIRIRLFEIRIQLTVKGDSYRTSPNVKINEHLPKFPGRKSAVNRYSLDIPLDPWLLEYLKALLCPMWSIPHNFPVRNYENVVEINGNRELGSKHLLLPWQKCIVGKLRDVITQISNHEAERTLI